MTTLDFIIGCIGVVTSLAAAVFWLWASLIKVPDSIDTFIGELQRIGKKNAYGAALACAAAICAVYAFSRSIGLF